MSFVPNFGASQVIGLPNKVTLTDSSVGSDGAIAAARAYLYKYDGTTLVPTGTTTAFVVWDLPLSTPLVINALDKDYALVITVLYINSGGTTLYTKTLAVQGFTLYNETFDYSLTTMMASNPTLINDNNFFNTKSLLRTYIDSGDQAITQGADQFNAQLAYDLATNLRTNSQYFFNINS